MSDKPQDLVRGDRQSALLRWAVENQSEERKFSVEESKKFIQDLDPKWMEALLGSAENDTDKMKALVAELKKEDLSDEARANCLEELTFVCELTHNANSLHKLDGLAQVVDYLSHSSASVRVNAAELIGTCVPNNPTFQQQLLELEAFPKLLEALSSDDPKLVKKALLCVSGFVRQFPAGMKLFMESDQALPTVVKTLRSEDLRIARRAAFFLTYLLYDKSNPVSTTQFKESGALNAVLEAAKSEDSDLREKSLETLKQFVKRGEPELAILRELGAQDIVSSLKWDSSEEEHPATSRQTAHVLEASLATAAPSDNPAPLLLQ